DEFKQGKKRQITIKNLLLHNSGLPPFRVYVDKLQKRSQIVKAVKNEPLTYEPGTRFVYSDLGFILLGEIVKKVSGLRLDKYMRRNFYYPLGMQATFFNPKKNAPWLAGRIPPAEIDTVYRDKTIQAEVHDERAWYMDGVAGHAGLFSNASDLAIYAQMLLNGGTYGGKRYLSKTVIDNFIKRHSKFVNRGYGFSRKSLDGFSTFGSLSSADTFGHLGFTGTMLWIDPMRDLAVIMLTNDTWPNRSYGKNINQVRHDISDAVISSIINE
ncbi:MAG TPA: serine hydrolase, partial [Balneolaceae bacterium]|nr:serine hydrolase [Balneolaceae bacterium]